MRGNAAIRRRSASSASFERCSPWSALWPHKNKGRCCSARCACPRSVQAGAATAAPPTWCNRGPGSLATPATLSILVVAVRANGRARSSPAASREKTWPVEGRRSPPFPSSPIAGARPNSAPPPDAGEKGTVGKIREWSVAASAAVGRIRGTLRHGEPLRACRSRCLSLASAASAAARDTAADFRIVWESRVERSTLPPSSVGPG